MRSNPNNWKSCDICRQLFAKDAYVYTVLTGVFVNGEVVKYNQSLPDGIHVGDCCIHALNTSALAIKSVAATSPREISNTSEDSV